jgi:hypothetical protein
MAIHFFNSFPLYRLLYSCRATAFNLLWSQSGQVELDEKKGEGGEDPKDELRVYESQFIITLVSTS